MKINGNVAYGQFNLRKMLLHLSVNLRKIKDAISHLQFVKFNKCPNRLTS